MKIRREIYRSAYAVTASSSIIVVVSEVNVRNYDKLMELEIYSYYKKITKRYKIIVYCCVQFSTILRPFLFRLSIWGGRPLEGTYKSCISLISSNIVRRAFWPAKLHGQRYNIPFNSYSNIKYKHGSYLNIDVSSWTRFESLQFYRRGR